MSEKQVEAEESKDDSAVANGHVGPPPEHVKVEVVCVSIAHGSVDAVMADPTFEPNE